MISVSDHIMEAMGFSKLPDPLDLSAQCTVLTLYSLPYVQWPKGEHIHIKTESGLSFCIAGSPSEASKVLTQDQYIEEEENWLETNNFRPPFILFRFDSSEFFTAKASWISRDKDLLTTYRAFSDPKKITIERSRTEVISSLRLVHEIFSQLKQKYVCNYCDTAVIFITKNGQRIREIDITMNAHAIVGNKLDFVALQHILGRRFKDENPQIEYLDDLLEKSSREGNETRRFQMIFTAIERFVEVIFKGFKKVQEEEDAKESPEKSADQIPVMKPKDISLSEKLMVLQSNGVTTLTQNELQTFRRLVKVRNGVSHGRQKEVDHFDNLAATEFAMRMVNSTSKRP